MDKHEFYGSSVKEIQGHIDTFEAANGPCIATLAGIVYEERRFEISLNPVPIVNIDDEYVYVYYKWNDKVVPLDPGYFEHVWLYLEVK
jgi:hypothetical protein